MRRHAAGPREIATPERLGRPVLLVLPVQQRLAQFLSTLQEYPFQQGSSLNAANINYDSLKAMQAMKRLKELETLVPGRN